MELVKQLRALAATEELADKAADEIVQLQEELAQYKHGYKGACYACEPVGELNIKQADEIKRLRSCVVDLLYHLDFAIQRSETDLFGSNHNATMDAISKAEALLQYKD